MSLDWDEIHARSVPASGQGYREYQSCSRRSVVFSTKGIVSCTQPLAAQCGLEILRNGGNAADAAVAVAAAMNVTEPCSTGIGGDAFCLYWDAKRKRMSGLNGSGKSPKALTLAKARQLGLDESHLFIPIDSIHSVTVPGTAACWVDTVKSFGSGKLKLGEILDPAARLAEEGFPVSEITASMWEKQADKLLRNSPNGHELLIPDGRGGYRAPRAGEIKSNPELARTIREVGQKGRDGFYKGRIAEEIVALMRQDGGLMTLDDLAEHTTLPVEPISHVYQDEVTLHELPANGQGIAALVALGIIDVLTSQGKINLDKIDHNSAEYIHILIEAIRIAFSDTRAFVSDPDHAKIMAHHLLSKEYLESRAALFDASKCNEAIKAGQPISTSDTVYFVCSDAEGNACSFIQSNYQGFGSCKVPKGCGFSLQNRGVGFFLEEGHANTLDGGKRPYHTICPAMATKNGELFLAYGVMGGGMQPQGHLQVLLNILHHRSLTLQGALDAPRICVGDGYPRSRDDTLGLSRDVLIEEGIEPAEVEKLRAMGHNVKMAHGVKREVFGRGQIIMRVADQGTGRLVWAGASDPRGDGHAVPLI